MINATATPITEYTNTVFTAETREGHNVSHDIYHRGSGAPIVLIQELPGIGQETLALADRLISAGFEVVMPHLFGPIGKTSITGNLVRVMCLRKEFRLLAGNKSSPIVDWLKLLCQQIRDEREVEGVGVIGMCLTGNFAISLIADDSVLAAVASQPAMPFFKQGELHMSPGDISEIRNALDRKGAIHLLRFEGDPLCASVKSHCFKKTFNDSETTRIVEITLPGRGHSVLTLDYSDEAGSPTQVALNTVIEYLKSRLYPSSISVARD